MIANSDTKSIWIIFAISIPLGPPRVRPVLSWTLLLTSPFRLGCDSIRLLVAMGDFDGRWCMDHFKGLPIGRLQPRRSSPDAFQTQCRPPSQYTEDKIQGDELQQYQRPPSGPPGLRTRVNARFTIAVWLIPWGFLDSERPMMPVAVLEGLEKSRLKSLLDHFAADRRPTHASRGGWRIRCRRCCFWSSAGRSATARITICIAEWGAVASGFPAPLPALSSRRSRRPLADHLDEPHRSGPVRRRLHRPGCASLAGPAGLRRHRRQDLAPQP